jgi:hypothetical protein
MVFVSKAKKMFGFTKALRRGFMFKRWLAMLGAVVLIVGTFQLLWGGGGGGDENPWHEATGSGTITPSGTGSATFDSRTVTPLRRIFIVRPAPMGGFYLIRVNLPSNGSAKTAAGAKKVKN